MVVGHYRPRLCISSRQLWKFVLLLLFFQLPNSNSFYAELLETDYLEPLDKRFSDYEAENEEDLSRDRRADIFERWENLESELDKRNDDASKDSKDEFQVTDMPKVCEEYNDKNCAKKWLEKFNEYMGVLKNHKTILLFAYETDMTTEKQKQLTDYSIKIAKVGMKLQATAHKFKTDNLDPDMKRQFSLLTLSATSKNEDIQKNMSEITSSMTSLYGHAQACPAGKECLAVGEIGVEDFMSKNQDYDQLTAVWKAWRDATGPKLKDNFTELVKLQNIGAKENNFSDYGYFEWFSDTDDKKSSEKVMQLYTEFLPLYKELHAYVRYRLLQKYPGRFPADGPIPAHILGNPWSQHWSNVDNLVMPYPTVSLPDVTPKLKAWHKAGNLTHKGMFKIAEDFFASIGLAKMTPIFWEKSMFKKPPGNQVAECHGSAFDFSDGKDYRIKMCADFTHNDLSTIHHEMGHVEYYMAYAGQPTNFREGANSGFHEAIGDTIALSVNTPNHMKKIGLLDDVPKSTEFDMNYLMKVALQKIAFIPFGLGTDRWRWWVYNGTSTPDNYNKDWWKIRSEMQGIAPPVPRKKGDCDALAKYHVAVDIPYIRYFLSFIMQFQFYKSMCDTSGYKGPLHQCDFYQSKPAGEKLKSMLSMGSSKPWPEAMEKMTGQRDVKVDAIFEFFKPLYEWLQKENKKNGVYVGWKIDKLDVE